MHWVNSGLPWRSLLSNGHEFTLVKLFAAIPGEYTGKDHGPEDQVTPVIDIPGIGDIGNAGEFQITDFEDQVDEIIKEKSGNHQKPAYIGGGILETGFPVHQQHGILGNDEKPH